MKVTIEVSNRERRERDRRGCSWDDRKGLVSGV